MESSSRRIIEKIFESRRLTEAEFEYKGVHYKAYFGKYTKDGKPISADDYRRAREDSLRGKSVSYNSADDEDLVLLANKGDRRAQDQIILRYEKLVRSIAKGMFLPGGDTEDLVQEGLLGIASAMKSYIPGRNKDFKQTAILAAKRNMLDAIEKANRKKHAPLNTAERPEDDAGYRASYSDRHDPARVYAEKEDRQRLINYMKKHLTAHQMRILGLYLQGFNYNQIADKLNTNNKAVNNAMNNIRARLKSYQSSYKESLIVGKILEALETGGEEALTESYRILYL